MKHLSLTLLLVLTALASYALGPITGTMAICNGSSATLSNATTGGTWSSTSPTVATINATTGVYTGLTTGVTSISYTDGVSTVTAIVTVNPLPAAITGTMTICLGGSTTLSDATSGGTWSSSNPAIAPVFSSGVVLGYGAGTTNISYVLAATGCMRTTVVSVNATVAAISGPSSICVGSSGAFTDATTGGTWASSSLAVLAISSAGMATGISAGVTTISYFLSSGCTAIKTVTVNPLPGAITGTGTICPGGTLTMSDLTAGGAWSSSVPGVISISPSTGVVTGVSAGTATITYTLGATGCFVTAIDTVASSPSVITGTGSMCTGGTLSLANATPGGTWSSANTSIATITPATGVATGVSTGTVTISYIVSSGCSATTVVTVVSSPSLISGSSTVCTGATTDLSDATLGGTWSSSDPSVAAISSTGIVTGIATGTATISYGIGTGCLVTAPMTVDPSPAPITGGPATICMGGTISLADATPGGSWASSIAAVAIVDPVSGVVTGMFTGTAYITYYMPTMCSSSTTVTVMTSPSAISGASTVCAGASTLLTDPTAGGTWSTASGGVATVSAAGMVTGISAGTTTISYGLVTGCLATHTITVLPAPAAISGPVTICSGTAVTYSDAISGGVWSALSPVTIDATTGVATTAATSFSSGVITYSLSSGCVTTTVVSVSPAPTVTASIVPSSCGGTYTGMVSGASTYTWAGSGLSCTGCSSPVITATGTATYTVTGVSGAGCSGSATVSITADRISGHIAFGSGAPASPQCRVWLIQFDPTDSSLLALDSTLTCTDGAEEYYQFLSKPAGSYMVKAKLLSAVSGTSDYLPTYGVSAPFWNMATPVTHSAAAIDTLHIDMLYGTVPAGPGFIAGLISAGAGKHTSGMAPVANLAVYLLNTSSNVLTYTTTDITGTYSFSGLANGTYLIYPEAFDYTTIPSGVITLTADYENAVGINFWQRTTSHIITPYSLDVFTAAPAPAIAIFPNPVTDNVLHITWSNMQQGSARIVVADAAGREWRSATIDIGSASGTYALPAGQLPSGIYFVTVTSANGTQTQKVSITH